jgi:hypothetical protein
MFYPPYWFDTEKPQITSINTNTDAESTIVMGYDEEFTLTWSNDPGAQGDVPVTSVSIVAPSSTTHNYNSNQRVVFLPIVSIDSTSKTATLKTPPTPWVAVPQYYMLFIMNGKTPGKARWIQLVDKQGVAQSA